MQILDLTRLCSRTFQGTASSIERHVFDHYSTFWAGADFTPVSLSENEIASRHERVLRFLFTCEGMLNEIHLPTETLRTALLIGNESANGHAFLNADGAIAWFAIECFQDEFYAKVFVMHELIHAIHYGANPEFAFGSMDEKNLVSRQLITEGMATYLTKRLWNLSDEEALWADALPTQERSAWMAACRNSERELFEFVAQYFDSSDPKIELFYASNPRDIFSFRAGYYVGLKVIERIIEAEHLLPTELLFMPKDTLLKIAQATLQERIN